MSVKLVEVIRAGVIESIHRGDLAVVDCNGDMLYSLGDVERITFFRSTAKPLQALAALECGIAGKFGLDLKEIAIIMSSHIGEEEHINILSSLMEKIGVNEKMLRCGIHEPYSMQALKRLYETGRVPGELHCNCSGKHLGLMAASRADRKSVV